MKESHASLGFVIEIYEESTGCIREIIELGEAPVAIIERILNIESFDPHDDYELEDEDIAALNSNFGLTLSDREWLVKLRRRIPLDELPYQVHTNRELALMLNGKKPLSVFYLEHPSENSTDLDFEKFFSPHVSQGRLIRRSITNAVCAQREGGTRTVLFALPHEAWRIDAYLLMRDVARHCGWNDGFERMEGRLLGYTEEQNDLFMDFLRQQRP